MAFQGSHTSAQGKLLDLEERRKLAQKKIEEGNKAYPQGGFGDTTNGAAAFQQAAELDAEIEAETLRAKRMQIANAPPPPPSTPMDVLAGAPVRQQAQQTAQRASVGLPANDPLQVASAPWDAYGAGRGFQGSGLAQPPTAAPAGMLAPQGGAPPATAPDIGDKFSEQPSRMENVAPKVAESGVREAKARIDEMLGKLAAGGLEGGYLGRITTPGSRSYGPQPGHGAVLAPAGDLAAAGPANMGRAYTGPEQWQMGRTDNSLNNQDIADARAGGVLPPLPKSAVPQSSAIASPDPEALLRQQTLEARTADKQQAVTAAATAKEQADAGQAQIDKLMASLTDLQQAPTQFRDKAKSLTDRANESRGTFPGDERYPSASSNPARQRLKAEAEGYAAEAKRLESELSMAEKPIKASIEAQRKALMNDVRRAGGLQAQADAINPERDTELKVAAKKAETQKADSTANATMGKEHYQGLRNRRTRLREVVTNSNATKAEKAAATASIATIDKQLEAYENSIDAARINTLEDRVKAAMNGGS